MDANYRGLVLNELDNLKASEYLIELAISIAKKLQSIVGLKYIVLLPDNKDLEKIYKENESNIEFTQKIKWLMAPTPEPDGDDTRAKEGFMTTKNGKISYVIPEHSVFPTKNPKGLGRFELDQGFEASEYGILFYKKIEK